MPSLEFCLPPAELPRLLRQPPFRQRGGRPAAVALTWHDTAEHALAGPAAQPVRGHGRLAAGTRFPPAWRGVAAGHAAPLPGRIARA